MNGSKFTDAEKAFILGQGEDGMPVADISVQARDGVSRKRLLATVPTAMLAIRAVAP